MGCGCKDPQEGLTIQNKEEWPEVVWPDGAMDEFQSKINSLQSEKNIWKSSYEDLSTQVKTITTKLDALLDTLPENIQQQFNEAFSEAPVAAETPSNKRVDKIFKFSVEVDLEVADDVDLCEVMSEIDIVPTGPKTNILEVRVGEFVLEPTNLDGRRQEIATRLQAQIDALPADPELF